MKRTAFLLKKEDNGKYNIDRAITCEVIGEMIDGSKVWEEVCRDEDDDRQYALLRSRGTYYFVRM